MKKSDAVQFVEESRILLWRGISRFGAFVFVAPTGAHQSVNSRLLAAIVSLSSYHTARRCAAISSIIIGFFLCMNLTGAEFSLHPTFQVTRGFFFVLPNSSASFRFCRHFECVLLNTIEMLLCR